MRGKRGDIDVQFNWVFVFIVGAIIIAIAVGFVTTQKRHADTIIAHQVVRFMGSVITHSISTSGKTESLDLQKSLATTCYLDECSESGCTSEIYVMPKSLKASITTAVEPIFSPTTLSGLEMFSWTMEWNMPYHAINFIYLTTDTSRYVFVGNDNLLDEIYSGLPDTLDTKEKVSSISGLRDKNNDKVKLIFFEETPDLPGSLESMKDQNVGAVKITPTQGSELGTLQFYKKRGGSFVEDGEEVPYLGKAALYGAIFAENYESYACNLKKSLIRLKVVSQSYSEKLTALQADTDVNPVCMQFYSEAQALITSAEMLNPSLQNVGAILEKSGQIRNKNAALKTKSCPVIY